MKKTSLFISVVLLLSLALSACQNTGAKPTSVDENSFATLVAGTLTAVAAQAQQTLDAIPTETATEAPTSTPAPTLTPTKEIVMLTINQDTNCRKGASTIFPVEVTIKSGTQVVMLGRNRDNSFYYVQNPEDTTEACWIWAKYATTSQDIELMPVFTPVPTPLPTSTPTLPPFPQYTAVYSGLTACGAEYAANFNITNTGNLIMESIRIKLEVDGIGTFTHKSDSFTQYSGGALYLSQDDLTPGESAVVSTCSPGSITSDPTNLNVTAEITICTKENLSGACTSQTLVFKPH